MILTEPPSAPRSSRTAIALAFASVILASFPLHELGHWIGFSLAGIPAAISLDHTYFTVRWQASLAGAAGGPVASIALAWTGAYLALRSRRLSLLGWALTVVMPLTRLATYAICAAFPRALAINDEGVMALDCGWPMWSWVWILLPLLVGPYWVAWRAAQGTWFRKLGLFGVAVVAWIALALVVEVGVLEPRLFPDAEGRELVMPHAPRSDPERTRPRVPRRVSRAHGLNAGALPRARLRGASISGRLRSVNAAELARDPARECRGAD